MKKDVSAQLPKKVFLPNQNGNKGKVVDKIFKVEIQLADFPYFLKKKDGHHGEDQILNHRCQTIPKRKTVAVVSHFNSP